jgi:hypothetical protein
MLDRRAKSHRTDQLAFRCAPEVREHFRRLCADRGLHPGDVLEQLLRLVDSLPDDARRDIGARLALTGPCPVGALSPVLVDQKPARAKLAKAGRDQQRAAAEQLVSALAGDESWPPSTEPTLANTPPSPERSEGGHGQSAVFAEPLPPSIGPPQSSKPIWAMTPAELAAHQSASAAWRVRNR